MKDCAICGAELRMYEQDVCGSRGNGDLVSEEALYCERRAKDRALAKVARLRAEQAATEDAYYKAINQLEDAKNWRQEALSHRTTIARVREAATRRHGGVYACRVCHDDAVHELCAEILALLDTSV